MSRFPEFDLSTVATESIVDRNSKVTVADFASPPRAGASFGEFLSSLPKQLKSPTEAAGEKQFCALCITCGN